MTAEVRKAIRTEPRRNPIRWLWRITLCVWLVGQLAIVESSWAAEGALLVIAILIDGRSADTVSEVGIIAPGQDKAEKRVLSRGTAIEQGAEIVVPRRTVLVLESANSNQIGLPPGRRFKVNVGSSEGENNNLGIAYYGLGEYGKAIGYYEKSLALRLKLYPEGVHPDILKSYRNLSIVWREAGEAPRSDQYAKKADEIEGKLKR